MDFFLIILILLLVILFIVIWDKQSNRQFSHFTPIASPASIIPSNITPADSSTCYTYSQEPTPMSPSASPQVTCTLENGQWVAHGDPSYQCASTTRYWDCSRPTCSYNPGSCEASNASQSPNCANNSGYTPYTSSGTNFSSLNNQPFIEGGIVYTTAAVSDSLCMNGSGGPACGKCYELQITPNCGNPYSAGSCANQNNQNAADANTRIVVMATNDCPDSGCPATNTTPNAAGANYHFDIAFPGAQWGNPPNCNLQFGVDPSNTDYMNNIQSASDCDKTELVPTQLAESCKVRFNNLYSMDNPIVAFKEIPCPLNYTQYQQLN